MKTFDPFTVTCEDLRRQFGSDLQSRAELFQWGAAQSIIEQRARYEASPIDGIAACVEGGLVAPAWLASAFLRQYRKVTGFEVSTWDQAFGRAKPKGAHLHVLKLKRLVWAAALSYPEAEPDLKAMAAQFGVTQKQVAKHLPAPKRRNSRGHRPYRTAVSTNPLPSDPFGRTDEAPKV